MDDGTGRRGVGDELAGGVEAAQRSAASGESTVPRGCVRRECSLPEQLAVGVHAPSRARVDDDRAAVGCSKGPRAARAVWYGQVVDVEHGADTIQAGEAQLGSIATNQPEAIVRCRRSGEQVLGHRRVGMAPDGLAIQGNSANVGHRAGLPRDFANGDDDTGGVDGLEVVQVAGENRHHVGVSVVIPDIPVLRTPAGQPPPTPSRQPRLRSRNPPTTV